MKINYYFYLFLLFITFIVIIFFPTDTELIYVFEKSNNLPELERLYQSVLNKKYNKEIDKKYINTLLKLNRKEAVSQADRFISTYKDEDLLKKVLNFLIFKKDYQNYEYFLKKGFSLFHKKKYLLKLVDFYSFIGKKENAIKVIKKLYIITKDEKWLNTLYGMGEIEFVINRYLSANNNSLNEEKIKKILYYFSTKRDYQNYIKFLKLAYKKTNNIKYLLEQKNIYSFLKDNKSLINILKKLFYLTKDYNYLDELYALGEKNFVIKIYETNIKNLNLKYLKKLAKFYLWNSNLKKLLNLYKNFIGLKNIDKENEKEFFGLLSFFADYNTLIKYLILKYKQTNNIEYLEKLADAYDYYGIGIPEKFVNTCFELFKKTNDKIYLDRIISMYITLDKYEEAVKYYLIKLKYFYTEKLLKQFCFFLINNRDTNKAIEIAQKYYKKDKKLFHFLISLYFLKSDFANIMKIILSHSPEELNKYELSFIATSNIVKPEYFPYILKYYELTKEKFFLVKILKYFAENKLFYKFNRFFKKYFGKLSEKNIDLYFASIPEKYKNFKKNEAIRLINVTFNINLLNKLGFFLLGIDEQNFAKLAFKKVLFLSPKNLIALEQYGKILYWENNFTKSLKIFLKYDAIKNDNPVIKFYIGEILYNKNRIKEAKKYFKYVIKHIKKNSLENKMIYLKSYVFLYGIDDILEEYKKVVKESGYNRDVYADFIDALYFSKRYDILKDEYEKFKKLGKHYTNYIRLLRLFAKYNIDIEDFKIAKNLLDKAFKISKNSAILSDYGYLYYQKGDRYKALQFYKEALKKDRKNKDLIKVVKELEDDFSRNINITSGVDNKVHYKKFDINLPFKGYYWFGFSYHIFQNKNPEVFLRIQDINKNKFLIEAGVRHFYLSAGNKYKIYYKDTLFTEYTNAIDEKLMHRKIGFKVTHSFKNITASFDFEIAKDFYRNKRGKVAETYDFDTTVSVDIYKTFTFSTGFSYVKLNYYNSEKSNVFFDDYRALSFFLSKYKNYDDKDMSWNIGIGTIYDLISKKYNYAGNFHIKIKGLTFDYNLYYDAFSKEQIDRYQFNWRITF